MKRKSGVLLPVFSLPGEYGCGAFSRHANEFIKTIAKAGFSMWQVLPFGITDSFHSPYMSLSSFGGNPWLIDPETLYRAGLVTSEELEEQKVADPYLCDYGFLEKKRIPFLKKAAKRFSDRETVFAFLKENPELEGTCRFLALREQNGFRAWTQWTEHTPDSELFFAYGFMQYEFHRQWDKLHRLCKDYGIQVIGDLPFYVSHDSYDLWSRPDSFWLDEAHAPVKVAGVPPDYFSPLGQKWGNPLYDWKKMEEDGFSYWCVSTISAPPPIITPFLPMRKTRWRAPGSPVPGKSSSTPLPRYRGTSSCWQRIWAPSIKRPAICCPTQGIRVWRSFSLALIPIP